MKIERELNYIKNNYLSNRNNVIKRNITCV